MKIIVNILALFLVIITFSSCQRSYSCTCTFKQSNGHDTLVNEGDIHKSKGGAFHECCTLKKQFWVEQGATEVSCVVPI